MNNTTIVTFSLVTSTILVAGMATALADRHDAQTTRRMEAPSKTLEIAVAGMYAKSSGSLGGGMQSVDDVAGPGGGADVSVGWRATPNLLIGGFASFAGFASSVDSKDGVITAAAGVKADWHFLPATSVDPWISLGAGGKFMGLEDRGNDTSLFGVEGRLQIGADFRVSPSFAFGPVIGASATMYTHEDKDAGSDGRMAIDDKKLNWNFTAGLQGRFNAFGSSR